MYRNLPKILGSIENPREFSKILFKNLLENFPKNFSEDFRNFVWEYTKISKIIGRPALGQSDSNTAGPAPILIEWHIIMRVTVYINRKLSLPQE